MDEVSLNFLLQDAQLLLNVMNSVNCQGKDGAIQLLRIIHALETVIDEASEAKINQLCRFFGQVLLHQFLHQDMSFRIPLLKQPSWFPF